jgi:hypothetical protein
VSRSRDRSVNGPENKAALAWVDSISERVSRAPWKRVVSRRPSEIRDDRERRVEVLECSHEVTVFASDELSPLRRCERCPPEEPAAPTPAARDVLPGARAVLASHVEPERPRAGLEE